MNDMENQTTYRNRFEALENLIKKEFPNGKIEYNENRTLIAVSHKKFVTGTKRNPRIVFHPDNNFMTDSDSDEEIFNEGIQKAKQILEDPPFKNRNFQGEIFLKHEGAIFKERETL